MALIQCPECSQSVSDTARKCPSCGYVLRKKNKKKIIAVIGILLLILIIAGTAYYFLIYQPQQIPIKASEFINQGNYIEADKLYAKLGSGEENSHLREQLYYESRILSAAKAAQENLLFPDSMILNEIVLFKDEIIDDTSSTETQQVYLENEPTILLHYLAKSKGGSMVDGFVLTSWKDGAYSTGRSVSDLDIEDTLPWYIDNKDYTAQSDFWAEQIVKGEIVKAIYSRQSIGSFDMDRVNTALSASLGKSTQIIPSGNIVVTGTPRIETVTPKPEK